MLPGFLAQKQPVLHSILMRGVVKMHRRRHWRRRPPKHFGRRVSAFLILGLLLTSCVYGYLDLLELVAVYGESRCRNLVTQLVLDAAAETKTAENLLDDIFDRLDAQRVERIVALVSGDSFGQTFITDTNRDHLDKILSMTSQDYKLFHCENGCFHEINRR